jgi:hypothetical protein
VSENAASRLSSLLDQLYWRLVQLVLVAVAACVAGALIYRSIARRA